MNEDAGLFDRGEFSLPPEESSRLLWAQLRWIAVSFLGFMGILLTEGWVSVSQPLMMGAVVGLGLVAAQPKPLHLVPLRFGQVMVGTWFFSSLLGLMEPLTAAGLVAGAMVGRGWLGRFESALASGILMVLVPWMVEQSGYSGNWAGQVVTWGLLSMAASMALVPAALRFTAYARVPSPSRIASTLQQQYRQPCNRAWQLDQELGKNAPDQSSKEGLAEVGVWVYRLAQTLQTLDQDIASINELEINARRDALLLEAASCDDNFIRDRHQGTARHLERLLDHRVSLVRERARTASLQEYALAYLEEARAGIALARVLPAERTPEQLGVVLEKLRNHAVEGGARRQAARELEGVRA